MGSEPESPARDDAGGATANATVARQLDEIASLLEEQGANRFRVQAYQDAATTLRRLANDVADMVSEGGPEALEQLPNIGESIAGAVAEALETGSIGLLERLRGAHDPVEQLTQIPGIGDTLARRAHEQLGIETLPELEQAAHDGSLAEVEGFGEGRIEALKDILDTRLRRRGRSGPSAGSGADGRDEAGRASDAGGAEGDRATERDPAAEGDRLAATKRADAPSVAELLDVDREYRERASRGDLRTIAPRRFNPEGEAWLPILHTERDDRSYTALFSNTARAHELGKTNDWVVIYVDDTDLQYTVVTAGRGGLEGQRVVRGREEEPRATYEEQRD